MYKFGGQNTEMLIEHAQIKLNYDLIFANILFVPLTSLAPRLKFISKPNSFIVLYVNESSDPKILNIKDNYTNITYIYMRD